MFTDPQATQYDPTPPLPVEQASQDTGGGSTRNPGRNAPLSESVSDRLPTYEPPAALPVVRDPQTTLAELKIGRRLGDYELLEELGTGSFGRVFLARQGSLDRLVALKVTTQTSGEARALAALEHDHIVRVFGEESLPAQGLYLLSMQYVPGLTLARVIHEMTQLGQGWSGRVLLTRLQQAGVLPGVAETAAASDAETLARCDDIEAICRLAARLAEALDHAHPQGILHRDVKPSNILLHRNGRVLLTDFNLATSRSGTEQNFGGTLGYMAPEHLDAFNHEEATPPEAVTAQADIYSLGVILFEMLTGRRPFTSVAENLNGRTLRDLAQERRREAPSPAAFRPDMPPLLNQVVRRCLAPDPAQRYASAGELARVLEGCRELYERDRVIPCGPLTRFARTQPAVTATLLPLLPHLLGAVVVFAYSAFWLAGHPSGQTLYGPLIRMALWYSAIIFPITGAIAYFLTCPIWEMCRRLKSHETPSADEVRRVRLCALNKPFWGTVLSLVGWLPGAILLPLLLLAVVPEVTTWDVVLQYALSYAIAGLIALTYTEFVDQFLLLRVAYPLLWVDPIEPGQTARQEMGPVEDRLRFFQRLSGMIPLATGIALMAGLVSAGPEQRASAGYSAYLILVTVLMVLGLAGAGLATHISDRLCHAATRLTGGSPAR